jgi:hypothetical protein
MSYQRTVSHIVDRVKKGFPVLSVTGPRQAGKTTFLQDYFPSYTYINLEAPDIRARVAADPRTFFQQNPRQVIIDEVQRVPELLSYIQVHVDKQKEPGSIIISGSQNLLIFEKVSQSLAGRVAHIALYPFSMEELRQNNALDSNHYAQMLKGFYPRMYDAQILPADYYNNYITTYVERDVRLITNVTSLSDFQRFMVLLAGRVGQILNTSSLANDVGVTPSTIEDWISILEASYIAYRLQPYYRNFGKRVIKSPKIFFYDVGLLCRLLQISDLQELYSHYAVGSIFENFIVNEVMKHIQNESKSAALYYYRDSNGNEIDLVIETGPKLIPVEIKSSATFNSAFFSTLGYWHELTKTADPGYVIYAGDETQPVNKNVLVSWKDLEQVFGEIT